MKPYLVLYDIERDREFTKEFETEFERDRRIRKLKYSTKLIVVRKGGDRYV